uniref:Sushi domain-containing protein n=1 Tax=Chrysemys picta bellii TaxID=8478 RepID=A0A8C3HW55_CHRPI
NQSSFPVGKTINYTCRPGYSRYPRMQSTITCLENRKWSEAFEFCKSEYLHGFCFYCSIKILEALGCVHAAKCNMHRLIGQPYRRCEISGLRVAWSGEVPICERILCLPPPDIPNGRHTGVIMDGFSYGSSVTYKCDSGYPLTGEASIHCTTKDGLNGEWSARPPRCGGGVRCPAPQIRNGRRVSGDRRVYSYKDSVTFECNPGYTMKGHSLSQCQTDDTWDPPLPVCEPGIPCLPPPDIPNGKRTGKFVKNFSYGSAVTYKCDSGFPLIGEASIHCTTEDGLNGVWSAHPPRCGGRVCIVELSPNYSLFGEASLHCTASGA